MGTGSNGQGMDPAALLASAFMPQTRSPAATGVGQATTPGYSQSMSLFAPLMQPQKPPPMSAMQKPAAAGYGAKSPWSDDGRNT